MDTSLSVALLMVYTCACPVAKVAHELDYSVPEVENQLLEALNCDPLCIGRMVSIRGFPQFSSKNIGG